MNWWQNVKHSRHSGSFWKLRRNGCLKYLLTRLSHATHEGPPTLKMEDFPPERIRNFSIIAHIDHGKSTLADRMLEITNTIGVSSCNKQVLDKLQVERERGITVKAQTASMLFRHGGRGDYLLNLIDTPGHVDFSYEVSRSLAACQGAVLLVDANQGVQAQTVANFFLAFEKDLEIIAVMNKIDLKNADPDSTAQQIQSVFDIERKDVLQVSAKLGTGVEELLGAIVERIPAPPCDRSQPLSLLLFDSWFDKFRGAVLMVAVKSGMLRENDEITAAHSGRRYTVQQVGLMRPDEERTGVLFAGQVGYVVANMKTAKEAQVGDTLYHTAAPVAPLHGFRVAKPTVFAGVFPLQQSEFVGLRGALDKLLLNDASVSVAKESSTVLGQGWRLGFLGLLHMSVFNQRLEQEHDANIVLTAPSVPFKAILKDGKAVKEYGSKEITIISPQLFPDPSLVETFLEPIVIATIITPDAYLDPVVKLCMERRGHQRECIYIDQTRLMLKWLLPLNEIIVDFFDQLKANTSGYASFDYEEHDYQPAEVIKVDFLLNGKPVEELSMISNLKTARATAKSVCSKLKENINPQLFKITIQASVGSKVIAREDIKAVRKDVTAKCYGGDITRKMKLLKHQAEGKKRMRMIGNVEVPRDAFIKVLQRS